MVVWRLAFADIKRKKSLTATIVLLSLLAVLFLNLGLVIQEEMKTAYPKSAKRLESPDFITVTEGTKYKTSFESFLEQDKRVKYVEKDEIIYMENTKNSVNSLKAGAIIFNKDAERKIEPIHLFKEDKTVPKEKAIYLPRIFEESGASLGEEFTLTFKNIDYKFQVAGFFETSYMGTTGYALMKYFVPEDSFGQMYETIGTGTALSVRLRDHLPKIEASKELKKDFLETTNYYTEVGGLFAIATCLSYYDMKDNIMSLLGIPMIILISMAFILGLIVFIIVYFKVRENIEESMVNIGSLQAMGYTSRQIILSEILQFAFSGAAGGGIGVLFTYIAVPFTFRYGEGMVGISIKAGIHIGANLLSVLLIIGLMIASSMFASFKIQKISPVTALRKGVQTHHFGKNFFPLDRGKGSLYYRLALKNMASGFRQSITTILTVGLAVFAIALSVVLYANFAYDKTALIKMTGIEIADVQIKPLSAAVIPGLQKDLEAMEEVRKISQTESYMAKIGEENLQFTISDDFKQLETISATKGEMPEYDNEVVLTSAFLKKVNKSIGDTISVTARGITREYLITGNSPGTNNGGNMGLMSLGGIQRIDPYYTLANINVYLKDKSNTLEFMNRLYQEYGVVSSSGHSDESDLDDRYAAAKQRADEQIQKLLDQYGVKSLSYAVMQDGEIILSGDSYRYKIKEISSLAEYLDGQLASYTAMMNGIMAVILFVMLLVMGVIISITIKSVIRRKKEEFGIYKAMGYTTKDLVKIIRLDFTVSAVIGSGIGILLCRLMGNQILCLFFNSLGLSLTAFEMKTVWLIGIGLATVLYVCLLSTYKAYQVRKITVYELLTE